MSSLGLRNKIVREGINMIKAKDVLAILAIVCGISLIGNWIAVKIDPLKALPGMLILGLISFAGWGLSKVVPIKLPSIVYISLIGVLRCLLMLGLLLEKILTSLQKRAGR